MAKLTDAEIEIAMRDLPDWQIEDGKLVRDYTFADFVAAMEFVTKVAAVAESANHHPDIDIRYNQVRLGLISHDSGGLTRRDVKLAARIDADVATG
jgi:4a-hydroxytetrahydrobiopterin dehydratase